MQLASDDVETRPGRSFTVVGTNTMHIETNTRYTTLRHVPSRHTGIGAVGSLVAECHVCEACEACRVRNGGPRYKEKIERRLGVAFTERIKVLTLSVSGTSKVFLRREQETERSSTPLKRPYEKHANR